MIDVEKLRKVKGRRIYQFWLDEETGDITDVTSRDDVIQIVRCKDCKYHFYERDIPYCANIDYGYGWRDEDYCSKAERKE